MPVMTAGQIDVGVSNVLPKRERSMFKNVMLSSSSDSSSGRSSSTVQREYFIRHGWYAPLPLGGARWFDDTSHRVSLFQIALREGFVA